MVAQSLGRCYHLDNGPSKCAMKLDISKAFDSLRSFLFLEKMGLPDRFISWLKLCITSPMCSIKVNWLLEGYFKGASALHQGNPLFPFIFVMAMEEFSACVKNTTQNNSFKYHWGTKVEKISHLIFADDVLLFCHGDA